MHLRAVITKPGHSGYQNQPCQHKNQNRIPKTSPKLLPAGLKWIMGTLHIFSKINYCLPALRICLLINTQIAQQKSCMTALDFFHLQLAFRSAIYLLYTIVLAIFWREKLMARKQIEIYSVTHSFCCFVLLLKFCVFLIL